MKITTGAVYSDGKRSVDITVSTEDVAATKEGFEKTPLLEQAHTLLNTGDLMVVDYLRAQGEITDDFFRSRVHDIKTRYTKESKP